MVGLVYQHYKIKSLKSHENEVVDSLKQKHLKELKEAVKIAINNREKEIVIIEKIVKEKTQLSDSLITEYEAEKTLAKCDTALKALIVTANEQNRNIIELNKQVYDYSYLSDIQDSLFIEKEKQFFNVRKANHQLQMQLNAKDNWWNRNKFEVGIISGVTVSVASVILLNKLIR